MYFLVYTIQDQSNSLHIWNTPPPVPNRKSFLPSISSFSSHHVLSTVRRATSPVLPATFLHAFPYIFIRCDTVTSMYGYNIFDRNLVPNTFSSTDFRSISNSLHRARAIRIIISSFQTHVACL